MLQLHAWWLAPSLHTIRCACQTSPKAHRMLWTATITMPATRCCLLLSMQPQGFPFFFSHPSTYEPDQAGACRSQSEACPSKHSFYTTFLGALYPLCSRAPAHTHSSLSAWAPLQACVQTGCWACCLRPQPPPALHSSLPMLGAWSHSGRQLQGQGKRDTTGVLVELKHKV